MTTKIQNRPGMNGVSLMVPAVRFPIITIKLGESWGHSCTHRIILLWFQTQRHAWLCKSSTHGEVLKNYIICADGVRDVEAWDINVVAWGNPRNMLILFGLKPYKCSVLSNCWNLYKYIGIRYKFSYVLKWDVFLQVATNAWRRERISDLKNKLLKSLSLIGIVWDLATIQG